MGWIAAIVAAVIVLLVVWAAVVWSRRSPAALSEEHPHPRQPEVVDRPAGPAAEATGVEDAGAPSTDPALRAREDPGPRPPAPG